MSTLALAIVRWRTPWRRFLPRAALACALTAFIIAVCAARYDLAVDPQAVRSAEFNGLLLVDTWDQELVPGAFYAFTIDGLEPVWPDGTVFVKALDGIPGAHVEVGPSGVRLDGREIADGLPLARQFGVDPALFTRDEVIPPGQLWMMGRTPESLDSRYWGPLDAKRIIGRAWLVW